MRFKLSLVLSKIVSVLIFTPNVQAIDGFMIRVTAEDAPIKAGEKVLATVPKGTRLWAFEVKDGQWAQVKVPDGEEKGWLYKTSYQPVQFTDAEKSRLKEAYAHYNRYVELQKQHQLKPATDEIRQFIVVERDVMGTDHPYTASALDSLGNLASDQADYAAARKYYEEALLIRRKVLGNEHSHTANTLHNLGLLTSRQGNYSAAHKYYDEALAIQRKVLGNEHPDTANTLKSLGVLAECQADYAAARKLYDEALAIQYKVLGNEHLDTAGTLNNLGVLADDQSDYAAARKYYEEALRIRRKVLGNEHPDTASSFNNLGAVAHYQADYAAARKYYEEALLIRRKVLGNEHPDTADTLNNLGVLASDQGNYAAARKYYDEALVIRRKVLGNEHPNTANSLNNAGIVAWKQADFVTARKFYEEALAIQRKVLGNKHADTASTLNNLGIVVSDQGDFAAARKYYEEALLIRRKVLGNEHPDTAITLNSLGVLASDQGDYAAARKYYEESLVIRRKVLGNEHPDTADSLNNLGIVASQQGDQAAARKYFEEALVVKRKFLGNEHPDTAMILHNLGMPAGRQADYVAERKYYEEALAIRRKVLGNDHPDTAETLNNLAWMLVSTKNYIEAAERCDEARHSVRSHEAGVLPALSEKEQLLFLSVNHEKNWTGSLSFGRMQRADVKIVNLSAGWLVNGKAMMQEALAEGALLSKPETAPLVAQLRAVRAKLAQVVMKPASADRDRQLVELEGQQQKLVQELGRARGEDLAADPWISTESIRQAIPAQSALVNIVRFAPYDFATKKREPAQYVAWLIPAARQGEIQIIDLGEAAKIDAVVADFRKSMEAAPDKAEANEAQASEELAKTLAPLVDLVWKPLAAQLANTKELILSPDGALWLVPWAALPVDDKKFLLEKYRLRYVVSGRELVAKHTAQKGSDKSVVMANPDFDLNPTREATASPDTNSGSSLLARRSITRLDRAQRLPGTAREARAILPSLEKYGHTKPIVYLDREATESQFKQLVAPQVLVLGTHGFFFDSQEIAAQKDEDRPLRGGGEEDHRPLLTQDGKPIENPLLRCGLLLAGCNRPETNNPTGADDGVLTGLEIVGTELRGTDLVVLSACETGVGEVHNGEGVAGLRQAFQLAGAKSVVATLWQIPDDETAQLMNDFFGYLAEGKSKTDALRYAQLNRIAEHREKNDAAHPFYWAAFTLTGSE